ncbi:MAG TPA: hypothetical protein VFV01_48030 [Spirillospora sp.]|nr:hypothetical protein [Spirillospora sp.]
MEIAPVPESAKLAHPSHRLVDMGRPDGVAEEDCGTAQMLLGATPALPGFAGRDQLAYFKPSQVELDWLNAGGYVVMNQIGSVVQPFSVSVWPGSEPLDSMVEIGGQRMTQAQFDAARAPLLDTALDTSTLSDPI